MANFFTRPNFEDRQIVQYSADTITLSGDTNINSTGNFRIYKDAFPGLVATSLDNDGTVGWGPISGISWSVSACTSPLYVNNLVSCPSSGGTIQVDAGNLALNSELNFLISLSAGTNTDEVLVIDSNGYIKTVPQLGGVGNMWYVPYGYTLMIPDNYQSFVYGDVIVEGVIDLQTNAQLVVLNGNIVLSGGSIVGSGTTYLVTLGSNSCCFTGGTGSCITDLYVTNIHGCSPIHIQPTSADDVIMVEGGGNVGIGLLPTVKLHVSGETIVNANKMMLSDSLTTIPSVGTFEGIFSVHDSLGLQGFLSNNTNPSGVTGTRMYNDLSVDGLLLVGGSQTNRPLTPLTGNDFYRNKIILKGGTTSEGMVFNAASSDPSSTFWWEFNGASGMVLKGDGSTTGAYLGLALNPDGTEMPTSSLQIGGTGTTGTFQYRDGNESSGYTLTCDVNGVATWQPPIIIDKTITIPSVDVLTLFTTPYLLIASPGVGYYIQVLTAACKVNFNSIAYAVNTTLNVYTDTATRVQHAFSNGLNATLSRIGVSAQQGTNAAADTQLISDKGVYLTSQTGNPTTGDSDIIIYLTYRIIQE
jgi:hypothetical protein